MKKCPFCSIVKNNIPFHEIVWSDKKHIAFLDIYPVKKGHVLVIPKKHSEHAFNLSEQEYSALLKASRKVALILKKAFKTKRVALFITGTSVLHTHIHLLPFNKEGELGTFHELKVTQKQLSNTATRLREYQRNHKSSLR